MRPAPPGTIAPLDPDTQYNTGLEDKMPYNVKRIMSNIVVAFVVLVERQRSPLDECDCIELGRRLVTVFPSAALALLYIRPLRAHSPQALANRNRQQNPDLFSTTVTERN